MTLDVFQNAQRDAIDLASRNVAPNLPATFAETFDSSLRTAREWANSDAFATSRFRAGEDMVQDIKARTGTLLPYPAPIDGGSDSVAIDTFNAKLAELKAQHPDLNVEPLTQDAIDGMGRARMAGARTEGGAMGAREKTFGGSVGGLLGGLAGGSLDPINMALLPLGGLGSGGLLVRAAEFGAIGAGSQAINEVVAGPTRERAVPGTAAEAGSNILEAAAGGAIVGGGLHVAGQGLRILVRLLGFDPRPLPTSARDDLHAATSEAQIASTNVLPGVAGEVAHRDALNQAVGQIARGERVTAGEAIDPGVMQSYRDSVAPQIEAYLQAQAQGRDMAAGEGRALADRLAASPAEAERLLNEAAQRPITFGERIDAGPAIELPPRAVEPGPMPSRDLATAATRDAGPETVQAFRTNDAVSANILHDLEHIRAEQPDAIHRETVFDPDGTSRTVERPLNEVLADLDGMERAGRELEACLIDAGIVGVGAGAGATTIGAAP